MRRPSGFTLIEVVIAMAIGVFVVLAVIGTVQSLSRAARTLEASGAEDDAWLRFSAIFRRDVRGWVPGEERREGTTPASESVKPFFVFQTTADALFGSAQAGEQPAPRMAAVRYSVKRDGEEFTIVRREDGKPNHSTVPILRTKSDPKIEFFDGQRWNAGSQGQQVPVAVKLTVGSRSILVANACITAVGAEPGRDRR
jgi:prepilin-type N-terminal cleavage/methylation domain-containing protein